MPNQYEDTQQCGHHGLNWDGEGNCITCARDKVDNSNLHEIVGIKTSQYEDKELREQITHIVGDCQCHMDVDDCYWWSNPGDEQQATEAIMALITQKQLEARIDGMREIIGELDGSVTRLSDGQHFVANKYIAELKKGLTS
ncbi:hypothetical protein [Pseudarthrobacter sp. ATCC 49987]|uniref:hypothetical protein n=1 Tax=Pseudarthrobacter sp. ATCC 49987 TaxID=2698204 RepID=UPI001371E83D|nr:hypothetical protein [Pseudarthrobacter sp. ATCC 49987]